MSEICYTKAILFLLSLISLVAAGVGKYQFHEEKTRGHHSEIKIQRLSEKNYKDYVWKANAVI